MCSVVVMLSGKGQRSTHWYGLSQPIHGCACRFANLYGWIRRGNMRTEATRRKWSGSKKETNARLPIGKAKIPPCVLHSRKNSSFALVICASTRSKFIVAMFALASSPRATTFSDKACFLFVFLGGGLAFFQLLTLHVVVQ